MTPTEIDNMPAGAKLDVLVAKTIGDVALAHRIKHGQFDNGEKSFRPSSDWNDAMEAAEKCAACFEIHSPRCWDNNEDSELWNVMVVARPVDKCDHYETPKCLFGSAPTGPLAIARAIAKIGATK